MSLIGYSAKFLGYEIFPLETSQIKGNQKRNIERCEYPMKTITIFAAILVLAVLLGITSYRAVQVSGDVNQRTDVQKPCP